MASSAAKNSMSSVTDAIQSALPAITGGDPLAIYLNDHLGGSTSGVELAKRAARSNQGTEFAAPLGRLASDIAEDREALQGIMHDLEVAPDHLKTSVAWAGEKVGRLKPNGQLTGYSPLGRLLEIELLFTGVNGKLCLWRTLQEVAPTEPRLSAERLKALAGRAEAQRDTLDDLRGRAAAIALSRKAVGPARD